MITVTQARENDRTTFCRQFTFNKNGYSNREVDGAVVSGMPVAGILVKDLPDGTEILVDKDYTGENVKWKKVMCTVRVSEEDYIFDLDTQTEKRQLLTLMKSDGFDILSEGANQSISDYDEASNILNNKFFDGFSDTFKTKVIPAGFVILLDVKSDIAFMVKDLKCFLLGPWGYTDTQYFSANVLNRLPNLPSGVNGIITNEISRDTTPSIMTHINSSGVIEKYVTPFPTRYCAPFVAISEDSMVSPEPNGDGSYNIV